MLLISNKFNLNLKTKIFSVLLVSFFSVACSLIGPRAGSDDVYPLTVEEGLAVTYQSTATDTECY